MTRYPMLLTGALALAAALLPGCSLIVNDFAECSADADCAGLGAGLVCRESFCVQDPNPGPECTVDADCAAKGADYFCDADACVTDPMVARCGRTLGAERDETTLVLGAMLPFTTSDGDGDPRGQARANGLQLAVEEINEREGVNGRRKLSVVVCDTGGDTATAKAEAAYLIRRFKVPALLTSGSGETISVSAEAIPSDVLVMSVSATSAEITQLSDKHHPDAPAGLVWRTAPSDAIQGKVIADILLDDATADTKVAVLAVNDPYAQGLSAVFKTNFGTERQSRTFSFERNSDGATALQQADDWGPTDVLFIGFPAEATPMLNAVAAKHANLKQARWFFTDSTKNASLFSQIADGGFLDKARGTAPATVFGEAYTGFSDRFRAKFQDEDPAQNSFTAHAYDAMYLVALAASWAATETGEQPITGTRLAEGLTKVSGENEIVLGPLNYTAARAELEAGRAIDILGASGSLNFDPATGEAPANIEEWQYTAGSGIQQVEVHNLEVADRLCRRKAGAAPAEGNLTFGALLPFTTRDGKVDPRGQARLNAISLAADEINSRGVLKDGRKMTVVVCDTIGNSAKATQQAEYLMRTFEVPALFTAGSGETLSVAVDAIDRGVRVMSGSATSPEITGINDKKSPGDAAGLVWRVAPSDAIQGKVIADLLLADPTPDPKVAVLYVDDPYGQGLANVFRTRYGSANSQLFLFEPNSDGANALTDAELYDPTHVLLIGFPAELVPMLNDVAANRPNLRDAKWFFSDSAKAPTVFSQVTDRAFLEDARGTAPASLSGAAYESFRTRYKSKFGGQDPAEFAFTAHYYDATYLLSLSAAWAATDALTGSIDGVRMAEGLTKLSDSAGTDYTLELLSYRDARDAVAGGDSIDVAGASGPLDFDNATGEASSSIEEWSYTEANGIKTVKIHDAP